MEMAETKDKQQKKERSLARARGRIFKGFVTKKFPARVVIEFERTVYVQKFERYYKKKTRLHARLPKNFEDIKVGDFIKIQECRPLSKIIHFIVVEKIKSANEVNGVKAQWQHKIQHKQTGIISQE